MSRYFSKLAIRTGIAGNLGDGVLQQPAPHQNMPATCQRGLEVRMEKGADPAISEKSAVIKSHIEPSGGPAAGKDEVASSLAASTEIFPESATETTAPQNISPKENEQQYPAGRIEQSQPFEVSKSAGVETGNESDKRTRTIERQYAGVSVNETTGQHSLSEASTAEGLGRLIHDHSNTREETVSEERILPTGNMDKKIKVHGDRFSGSPASIIETQKTVNSSEKLADSPEATQLPGQTKFIHIAAESSQPVPHGEGEQVKQQPKEGVMDIHIGTISFEVHQAPPKATPGPAPLPRPAVVSKSQRPSMPRLSRYYLKGW